MTRITSKEAFTAAFYALGLITMFSIAGAAFVTFVIDAVGNFL